MKSTEAKKLLDLVEITIRNIKNLNISNPLEKSYLAGYLIVFICGIYEESIERIIYEKASKLKDKYISNYVQRSVGERFRNPCMENIFKLLDNFDSNWKNKIKQLPYKNKTALDNIITNKNSLAHTGSITTTLKEVIQYYQDSRVVIEEIDDIIL